MSVYHQQREKSRRLQESLLSTASAELSHYEVLQVPPTASAAVIKEAYYRAARQHHPDKRGSCHHDDANKVDDENDDDATFRRIHAAWKCLRDPETRTLYNQERSLEQAVHDGRRRNAVPIHPHECREVSEPQDDDGDNCCYYEYIYQCRCGNDLHTQQLPVLHDGSNNLEENGISSSSSTNLIQCPGCSLVYDISSLYDSNDDEIIEQS